MERRSELILSLLAPEHKRLCPTRSTCQERRPNRQDSTATPNDPELCHRGVSSDQCTALPERSNTPDHKHCGPLYSISSEKILTRVASPTVRRKQQASSLEPKHTGQHTHVHIYIYIYINSLCPGPLLLPLHPLPGSSH